MPAIWIASSTHLGFARGLPSLFLNIYNKKLFLGWVNFFADKKQQEKIQKAQMWGD